MLTELYFGAILTRFEGLESEIAIRPILLGTACSRSEVCVLIYVETTGEHSARGVEDRMCLCRIVTAWSVALDLPKRSPDVKCARMCTM